MEVSLSDLQLAELIKSNPSEGLKKAIDLYGGAVKVICRAILSGYSNEDIEEAVSDVFANLWRNIDAYDYKITGIKSYIYGIARNNASNKKRSLAKTREESIDDVELIADESPEQEAIHKINVEIVRDMILKLKPPADKVFAYRYFYCLKVGEIAERLDISPKKVENILFRYKEKLKTEFIKRGIV